MPKPVKIKRYSQRKGFLMRPAPHPFSIIITVLGVAALVGLGVLLYRPMYDWIMGVRKEPSAADPPPAVSQQAEGEIDPTLDPEGDPASQPETPAGDPPQDTPGTAAPAEGLKVIYLPRAVAQDSARLSAALAAAPDCNAVMVDIKDAQGRLLYRSGLPGAEWDGASVENPLDLAKLAEQLEQKNISLVVRMAAFSDPVAARADRENNAVLYQGTQMLWLDNSANAGGKPWSNPYSAQVHEHLTGIAKEAAGMGAKLVVLDYFWFPSDPTGTATYAGSDAKSRADILHETLAQIGSAIAPLGARSALYLPADALLDPEAVPASRFGGAAANIAPQNLVVGLSGAGADAAAQYREALASLREGLPKDTNLIPLMPGAQTDLGKQAGAEEYILYQAEGAYTAASGS